MMFIFPSRFSSSRSYLCCHHDVVACAPWRNLSKFIPNVGDSNGSTEDCRLISFASGQHGPDCTGRLVGDRRHPRVRQVEPVLQEIHPQYQFQINRRTAVARPRVHRLNQCTQLAPRHHAIHLRQKRGAPCRLCVRLESSTGQRHLPVVSRSLPFLFDAHHSATHQTGNRRTCSEIP